MSATAMRAQTRLAVAFVALVTLPYWMPGIYYINVSSQVLFYAIFALGLNILVGYGGLVSLGHAGLFGIAAYATGLPAAERASATPRRSCWRWSSAWSATAVFAALSLRATGIGFIMITLALGQIIWGLAYRWISLTGGDNGINVHGTAGAVRLRSRLGAARSTTRRWSSSWSRSSRWRSSCARRSARRLRARATSRAA